MRTHVPFVCSGHWGATPWNNVGVRLHDQHVRRFAHTHNATEVLRICKTHIYRCDVLGTNYLVDRRLIINSQTLTSDIYANDILHHILLVLAGIYSLPQLHYAPNLTIEIAFHLTNHSAVLLFRSCSAEVRFEEQHKATRRILINKRRLQHQTDKDKYLAWVLTRQSHMKETNR